MNLDPIVDYLAAELSLNVGGNAPGAVFGYQAPAGIDDSILVVMEPELQFVDHEIKGVFSGRIQTIVRGKTFTSVKARAAQVFATLDIAEVDMTEYVVTYCRPRNTPFPLPRSEGGLIEFSINFDIRYRTL